MSNDYVEKVDVPVYRCKICGSLSTDKALVQACANDCLALIERANLHDEQIVGTTRTNDSDKYRVNKVIVCQSKGTKKTLAICHNIKNKKEVTLPVYVVARKFENKGVSDDRTAFECS